MTTWDDPLISQLWVRRHWNGWDLSVTYQGNGNFAYSVVNIGKGLAGRGGTQMHTSLADIQELADGTVPEHDCCCPGWFHVG